MQGVESGRAQHGPGMTRDARGIRHDLRGFADALVLGHDPLGVEPRRARALENSPAMRALADREGAPAIALAQGAGSDESVDPRAAHDEKRACKRSAAKSPQVGDVAS